MHKLEATTMPSTVNKVLIVYHRFPPIAAALKKAFVRQGIQAEIFYTTDYEHWFYHRVIRKINRHARNLRLIPKGGDLFKKHPLNLTNYVSSNFARVYGEFRPDALFVIHGLPFGNEMISKITVPRVGWHLEPRDDLPYLADNASAFDIYNSYSQHDVDVLAAAGYDSRYMCHAVDPEEFHPEAGVPKTYDVTVVGNWSAWRDETLKAALEVTDNVAVYGGYWRRKSSIPGKTLRRIYKGFEITGAELNHLYNSSRIVLNASRTPGSAGLNMRFFEVPAAGSILLTDTVPELGKHFVPGMHLAMYRDTRELKTLLSELLGSAERQESMRRAGQQLVLAQHTYDLMAAHVMEQFREILGRKKAV